MSAHPKASALEIELGRPRIVADLKDLDQYRHHDHFSVFYRRPGHEHWHLSRRYRDRDGAERAEHELRRDGYEVHVKRN